VNINSSVNRTTFLCQSWLILYLGILSACATGCGALVTIFSRTTSDPSVSINALTQRMAIPMTVIQVATTLTEAEKGFNAFVRLKRYADLPSEDHPELPRAQDHMDLAYLETADPSDFEGARLRAERFITEHEDKDEAWWSDLSNKLADKFPLGKAWEVPHRSPDLALTATKMGIPLAELQQAMDESKEPEFLKLRMVDLMDEGPAKAAEVAKLKAQDGARSLDPAVPPMLEFDNAVMRYVPNLEPNMKNVTFRVMPGEKVGVCGRTGAGKSTLFYGLFRLTELDSTRVNKQVLDPETLDEEERDPRVVAHNMIEGVGPPHKMPLGYPKASPENEQGMGKQLKEGGIRLGGFDISMFKLHDLRRSIIIIPQEPVIFAGSVKRNLDPLGEYSDEACVGALKDAHLDTVVGLLEKGIHSDAANAFSIGQKQLLCLARAVLRRPHILVLDEVTANVDVETDHLIQDTIKKKFSRCSTMTIAHRLDTIIDSDKILVMEQGQLAEYDHPHTLLQNPDGIFHSLVHNDKEKAPSLAAIAKKNWDASGEELTKAREDLATCPEAERATIEAKIAKITDAEDERQAAALAERQNEEMQRIRKAREEAVPQTVRAATAVILQSLEDFDSTMHLHPENGKAKLAMEEMWVLMMKLKAKMQSTHFFKETKQGTFAALSTSEPPTPLSTVSQGLELEVAMVGGLRAPPGLTGVLTIQKQPSEESVQPRFRQLTRIRSDIVVQEVEDDKQDATSRPKMKSL